MFITKNTQSTKITKGRERSSIACFRREALFKFILQMTDAAHKFFVLFVLFAPFVVKLGFRLPEDRGFTGSQTAVFLPFGPPDDGTPLSRVRIQWSPVANRETRGFRCDGLDACS